MYNNAEFYLRLDTGKHTFKTIKEHLNWNFACYQVGIRDVHLNNLELSSEQTVNSCTWLKRDCSPLNLEQDNYRKVLINSCYHFRPFSCDFASNQRRKYNALFMQRIWARVPHVAIHVIQGRTVWGISHLPGSLFFGILTFHTNY